MKRDGRAYSRQRTLPWLWLALLLLSLTISSPGYGAGGDIVWQSGDSQVGKQQALATTVDSLGNVLVTGYQNTTGDTNDNYYSVKFKADGSGVAWRAAYDQAGGSDQATAVAVDANNDVIVSGFVWNGLNKDIHTIKYSGATGAVLWQHTYNGSANGHDVATAVSVDSLNNIYVTGTSQNAAGNDDILILKYSPAGPDQSGNPFWQVSYNGPAGGAEQALSIAAGSDGVAVAGQSWNGTGFGFLTVKYDYSGAKLWEARHLSAGGGQGKKVRMDGGGNVVVTGYVATAANKDLYTVKYNGGSGTLVWEKSFDGGYDDEGNGLYIDAAGDVYLTGYSWTLTGSENFYTARYSGGSGALVWQQTFESGSGNTDVAAPIVVDEAGDLFVTGYTVTDGNYDFQTIKYKRDNGTQLWQQSFNATANMNDRPVGIGLSPAGEVLVAGWSDSGGANLDYYVVKYDPGLLNAPTSLTAVTQSDTSIVLTWQDNSNNEDGFTVERKTGEAGTYVQIATVGPNTTGYTDPAAGLTANTYYYYRVRSYNAANGNSHYSNEAHALTLFVNAQPPAWSYLYNNPDNMDDYANGIAVGPDNNPVVTGYSQRTVGGFDYYTVKLNRADRSLIWSDLYDDPDSEMDVAKCVAVDSANNAIVSGYSQLFSVPAARNINSIYTIKYPASGPPQAWGAQHNGPGAIDDRATAIATTADAANNIVVIGYGKNAANNDDIYVVKYRADGTKAWSATPFDGAGGDDIPSAVAVGPDGSVYVTGVSEKGPGAGVYNLFTAKYNGATGALVWSDLYSVTPTGRNLGNGIAVDASGDLYATGSATTAAGDRDIYTIKYSGSSGSAQRLWERAIDGQGHGDDEGIGVRIDPIDGAIVVAGTLLTGSNDHDISLVRYSAGGDTIWQTTLHENDDHATALAIDSSGYIYLAGSSSNGLTTDILSLIYGADGTRLGAMTYNGPAGGNDEPSGIAVNYKGEAFVAGYSSNASGNADYVVLKQTNDYILVPAPFTAVAQGDFSRINLNWGDNSPGTSFLIERTLGPVSDSSVWTTIKTASAGTVTYQDSGLNGNTSYCYRISAFNGSLFSRRIIGCATTTLPAPIPNPLAILSPTAIDISWANVAGNSGYKLERQASGGAWTQIGGTLAADTTIYHDTGLTAGTVYTYRVSTVNSAGNSQASSVLVAPVLNTPGGITSGKIDLTWPAVSGATGYKVERSLDGSSWSLIASPAAAATGYSDTSVDSGVLYYYRLKAVTATGESIPSLIQTATSKLKTPAINSAAGSSTTQIAVAWNDPNTNETGYTLEYSQCTYYADPVNCGNVVNTDYYWGGWRPVSLAANSTGATVGSLTPGLTYRFRVTATLSNANSDPSALATATTNLVGPTNLTATAATGNSVTLSWNDVIGETNYRVVKDGVVLADTGLPLGQNAVAYIVTGLSQNVPYCFTVQPYNAFSSADSNQACVTLYGPPTLNSVTVNSQTSVTLGWSDLPGATGFEVWQSGASNQSIPPTSPTSSGSWNAYINRTPTPLAAGTTSYTVSTGLTAGFTYKYKIRYKLADGSFSPYSDELMTTTIPLTPVNLSTTGITTSRVVLNWYDGYGESSYNVQVKQRAGSDCTTEDWTGITPAPVAMNTTNYYATGLNPGAVYCLRASAVNAGGSSPWTTTLTATTLLPAPVLSALTGVTQSQITLTWDNVASNAGYKVERSIDNVTWVQASLPAVDVVTFIDSNLLPNQIYYYRVYTKNSAGVYSSPASNVQSATTLAMTPPVLNPLSGVTTSQITLSWNDVEGNAGYKIESSLDNSSWTQTATPAQGATSYTNTGLTAGTLYYYRVSTKNSFGGFSVPSNVQSATTTPMAPVLSLAVVSEAGIDISWQVVLGATNYKVLRSIGPAGPFNEVTNLAIPYTTLYCGTSTLPSIGCPTLVPAYRAHSDTGLVENTQYCYQFKAWNATGGDSAASTTVCGKTPAVNGPTLTAVTAMNSQKVKLDWTYDPAVCSPVPCDTPDGFHIWRQAWNGEWVPVDTIPNVTTYLDTTCIEPQKTYSYKVRAYKGADTSAFSNVKGVTTPPYSAGGGTCP